MEPQRRTQRRRVRPPPPGAGLCSVRGLPARRRHVAESGGDCPKDCGPTRLWRSRVRWCPAPPNSSGRRSRAKTQRRKEPAHHAPACCRCATPDPIVEPRRQGPGYDPPPLRLRAFARPTTRFASADHQPVTATMWRIVSNFPEHAAAASNAAPEGATEPPAPLWFPLSVCPHRGDVSPNREAITLITPSPT